MVLALNICRTHRRMSPSFIFLVYMIFKASHSRLHDITLMKQHTSAGCLEMFSNEQACITLFKFLCCNVAFYSLISLETIEKVYSLSGKKNCIYELYLTCGLCKVNTTVSLCSGWVSKRFWFHSSKRETALHSPHTIVLIKTASPIFLL